MAAGRSFATYVSTLSFVDTPHSKKIHPHPYPTGGLIENPGPLIFLLRAIIQQTTCIPPPHQTHQTPTPPREQVTKTCFLNTQVTKRNCHQAPSPHPPDPPAPHQRSTLGSRGTLGGTPWTTLRVPPPDLAPLSFVNPKFVNFEF